jgi:signal peptidase I
MVVRMTRKQRWALAVGIPLLLLSFVVVTVNVSLRILGFRAFTIPSAAMVPTLQPGDRFFVDTLAYTDKAPQRGDVVTFVRQGMGETIWVKRVIAIGGDVIEGADYEVILNGHVLHEAYVAPVDASEAPPPTFGPLTVPAGKLFLVGDARQNSNDSRYFGFVDSKDIRGKVLYIYWSSNSSRIWQRVN